MKSFCKQVWSACKSNTDDPDQVSHEIDILAGHENDVNYVQFRFVSHCFITPEVVMFSLLLSYAVAVLWLRDLLLQIPLLRIAFQSLKIPGLLLLIYLSAFTTMLSFASLLVLVLGTNLCYLLL